jgi:ribonuclease HI
MESVKWVNLQQRIYEGFRLTTNNRMELLHCRSRKIKEPNTKVLVVSDSKYVVESLKMVFWLEKRVLDRKNADLWKRLLVIYRNIKSILNG